MNNFKYIVQDLYDIDKILKLCNICYIHSYLRGEQPIFIVAFGRLTPCVNKKIAINLFEAKEVIVINFEIDIFCLVL